MRIGVNCFLLQPHIGGLKQYFVTLFRELLEHDTANEYVFFWFDHNAAELGQLETDRWKSSAVLLRDQRQVRAHLDKIDVYFCPFGALYPCPLPIATVVTLVDIQEKFFPEFFEAEDLYNRDLYFESSTRMADRVVTISEFSKRTLLHHHGLAPHKVVVAHLSADERYYRPALVARAPRRALPDAFILYPANFWKHKNHERLLLALKLLRDRDALRIPIVFTGLEQRNGYPLESAIRSHGLEAQAHILGYLSVEEMAFLYMNTRMLVFPSLFEGFGIPLVEAMAAGCPVVAADDTSIPEVVEGAGELFNPTSPEDIARAIAGVWCDGDRRRTLADNGRRRARSFSARRTAGAHKEAFAQAATHLSYRRYLWNRTVYSHYYRTRVELRWRKRRHWLPR